jgi:localization factor PodJL
MSDTAWVLKGVDPQTRDRAVEEAQRRGVSLADYLTDAVLKNALAEQLGALAGDVEPIAAEPSDFGVRHRFRTLERRLEGSVGSLESALHALDTSLFDVTSRVGEVEGLAGDTAHALQQAQAETAHQLAAVRLHITDVEENALARDEEAAGAHASLSQAFDGLSYTSELLGQRLDDVEIVAARADTNAAVLADAHEALKHAVAGDFTSFAQDVSDRLSRGLRDVAAAADEAAAQADAAVAHLVVELRAVRASLEQSVADGVDETRRRMHAAFEDAAQRMEALSDRVDQVEIVSLRANEQLRIQLTDIEDAAHTSLEETAETLRQAGAALAADLQRSVQDNRAALESVHSDLAAEIGDLRERQQNGLARLKQVDAAVANTANELASVREAMLQRIAAVEAGAADLAARTQSELGEELDTLASRLAHHERDNSETLFILRAETERVEAAALVALEKLAQDIADGDAALQASLSKSASASNDLIDELRRRVESELDDVRERAGRGDAALYDALTHSASATNDLIEELRRRVEVEFVEVREQQAGAAARLTVIDLALGAQTQLTERLTHVEGALADTATKLGAVEARVDTLTAALAERSDDELAKRIEELRARLAAYENHASAAADGVNDLVRMLGRVTTQQADAAAKAEDRTHKLEIALADLKLEHLAAHDRPAATPEDLAALQWRVSAIEQRKPAGAEDVVSLEQRLSTVERRAPDIAPEDLAALDQRLASLEMRHAEGLDAVRADIVRFAADNDKRLAALEAPEVDYNLAAEFDALRRRVEDRILGVEQRSVRTLEQVADTVAMLEQRFAGRPDGDRQSA